VTTALPTGCTGCPSGVLARADLVSYFRARTTAARRVSPRVGIEYELLPVDPATGRAWPYGGPRGVEAALRELLAVGGFVDPTEAPHPIDVRRAELSINLEPGAQTELSGTPFESLADVRAELDAHLALLRGVADRLGFCYLGYGVQPVSLAGEIEPIPKPRYALMVDHFERYGGRRALDMMRRTASLQASLDYEDEADAGRKLRVSMAAAPAATALFAHSPIAGGRATGRLSTRAEIWRETDDARCGLIPQVLEGPPEEAFGRYVDYALSVPLLFIRRGGRLRPAGGRRFVDFLREGLDGERPTMEDFELHLSTIFTVSRLKGIVEVRSADGPRPGEAMAIPAFWLGLLGSRVTLEAAWEALGGGSVATADRSALLDRAAREGLAARLEAAGGSRSAAAGGRRLRDQALDLIAIARDGLRARGRDEEAFLAPAEEIARTGETAAERRLAEWGGDIGRLVAACRL